MTLSVANSRNVARIIAASNRQLDDPNEPGRLREDLYHRLNLVHLALPPLRERAEDIESLALRFLAVANEELGRDFTGIDQDALEALEAHSWPGNVRELEHAIKRSALTATGKNLSLLELKLDEDVAPAPDGDGSLEAASARALREEVAAGSEAPYQLITQTVEEALRAFAEEQGVKAGLLINGSRAALTGQSVGPSAFEVFELIGQEKTVQRLRAV